MQLSKKDLIRIFRQALSYPIRKMSFEEGKEITRFIMLLRCDK